MFSRYRRSKRQSRICFLFLSQSTTNSTKWSVRPAKTPISLDIRPVWSEYSLCAHSIAKDSMFLHADSARRTGYFIGFVVRRFILIAFKILNSWSFGLNSSLEPRCFLIWKINCILVSVINDYHRRVVVGVTGCSRVEKIPLGSFLKVMWLYLLY